MLFLLSYPGPVKVHRNCWGSLLWLWNDYTLRYKILIHFPRIHDNALVICNHAPPPPPRPPPAPGNSGGFDFWSSKSLLKAPTCGDCSLVKPLLFSPRSLLSFHFTALLAYIKQTPSIFPALPWQNLGQSPHSFPRLSPALPQGWGGPCLQMASA